MKKDMHIAAAVEFCMLVSAGFVLNKDDDLLLVDF